MLSAPCCVLHAVTHVTTALCPATVLNCRGCSAGPSAAWLRAASLFPGTGGGRVGGVKPACWTANDHLCFEDWQSSRFRSGQNVVAFCGSRSCVHHAALCRDPLRRVLRRR